jgi:mono/diheme cytochrome c family protein
MQGFTTFGPLGLLAFALLGSLALVAACSATPLGATQTGIATARQRVPTGAAVFERECAGCHGKRGEGLSSAPNIIGVGALPVYARDPSTSGNVAQQVENQQQDNLRPPGQQTRQPFHTAQDLFEFTSQWMPLPHARVGSLKPEEYWAVVNFVLVAHGASVPPEGVTPQNAKNIPVTPP